LDGTEGAAWELNARRPMAAPTVVLKLPNMVFVRVILGFVATLEVVTIPCEDEEWKR